MIQLGKQDLKNHYQTASALLNLKKKPNMINQCQSPREESQQHLMHHQWAPLQCRHLSVLIILVLKLQLKNISLGVFKINYVLLKGACNWNGNQVERLLSLYMVTLDDEMLRSLCQQKHDKCNEVMELT